MNRLSYRVRFSAAFWGPSPVPPADRAWTAAGHLAGGWAAGIVVPSIFAALFRWTTVDSWPAAYIVAFCLIGLGKVFGEPIEGAYRILRGKR